LFSLLAKFDSLGWNKRPLTEEDFFRICRRERIAVQEMPLSVRGFYGVCKARRFIALDSKMRGVARLFTAYHELGHHFLHAPKATMQVNYFHLREEPRVKLEADAFAAVALLPEPKLRRMLSIPVEEWEPGFTAEMIEFRLKVLELYRI
jgi:Zn-dependent peptidase ImmA (M78 family)